jgi:hypothetical protein
LADGLRQQLLCFAEEGAAKLDGWHEPLGFEDVESLAERGGFLLALATSRSFYRRMIAGA